MDVEFNDLSYTATGIMQGKYHGKTILKNVNGRFRSGELTAIMGPSGAGKSTLLNVISGYKWRGVKGQLKTNGQLRDEQEFHGQSCYIQQEDILQPLLNVQEVMLLAANLKLSSDISREKKDTIIDQILDDLGLTKAKLTRVERLSGGQKKRVSIALELITNPPVFFLDEPTSGLDNVSSMKCVQLLKRLSTENRTIICTIHQPAPSLFEIFDHVYIVSKGLCIYQGTPAGIMSFFSHIDIKCPKYHSPLEYLIELADSEKSDVTEFVSERISNGKLAVTDKGEMENRLTTPDAVKVSAICPDNCYNNNLSKPIRYDSVYHTDILTSCTTSYRKMWQEFYYLLRRMLLQTFRNKFGIVVYLIHHILSGVIVGLMFMNIGNDAEQFYAQVKYIMSVLAIMSYTYMIVPVMNYPQELKLVKKEYFNRWYGLTPYYAALTASRLPFQIFFSVIFYGISYYMVGFPQDLFRFITITFIGIVIAITSDALGLAIGTVSKVQNGAILGPLTLAYCLGFAIYKIEFGYEISPLMQIFIHSSFLRSACMGMLLVVFGFDRGPMDCNEVYCMFERPEASLKLLNLQNGNLYVEMAALLFVFVALKALGYILIVKRFGR